MRIREGNIIDQQPELDSLTVNYSETSIVKNSYSRDGNFGSMPPQERDTSSLSARKNYSEVLVCKRPLQAFGGYGAKVGPEAKWNPLYHEYLCVSDGKGWFACSGQDMTPSESSVLLENARSALRQFSPMPILDYISSFKSIFGSKGRPSSDSVENGICVAVSTENECLHDCIEDSLEEERPYYSIFANGTDCQEWVRNNLNSCKRKCGG